MSTILSGAKLYTEKGIITNGCLQMDAGKIITIDGEPTADALETVMLPENYHIIPGFIDLQLHGTNGCDTMDASSEALSTISNALPAEGTTSFLATTMTETDSRIQQVMTTVNDFCQTDYQGAELLGIHLEGPFISPAHVGAQRADAVIPPNIDLFNYWQQLSGNRIKCATLATEQPQGLALTQHLTDTGVLTSFGHSEADYDQAIAALEVGCTTATHVFNAMRGIHHREPNAITALLLAAQNIPQIIVDGVHLHPAIVAMIYRLKGRDGVVLVTDAMSAKGCPDGEYQLGGQAVYVNQGEARLQDGTLAGSTLTMRDAVRNLQRFANIDFASALHCATQVPANMLGIADRKGSLAVGKDADVVVLDEHYDVVMTFCRGKKHYG